MAAAAPIITAVMANSIKGAILRFALSLAVSYITQKLFGEEGGSEGNQSQADPGVKQRIPSDPSNKLPVVYGEEKIFGSIIFSDISSDNKTMAFIIALCEGPIHSINNVHWDDHTLTLNAQGEVTNATHTDGNTDSWLNGNLKVRKYPYGGPCTEMEAFSSKWNSGSVNRTMPDLAYAYIELNYDRENNVTGLTNKLGFEVKGKLIRLINSSGEFTGGFTPAISTMSSQFEYPEVFRNDVKFADFSGNQISGWIFNNLTVSITSFNQSHTKVRPGGQYNIVDLGPKGTGVPNINDYKNGSSPQGLGTGAEVEFDFLTIGEQYISNPYSSFTNFTNYSTTSYVDSNGVTQPDDLTRIPVHLNIKQWGNNYTTSTSNNDLTDSDERVWLEYIWTDVHGVQQKDYWSLNTWQMTPDSSPTYDNYTEEQYAERLSNVTHMSMPADIKEWGGRPRRKVDYTDYSGDVSSHAYRHYKQYFTAPVPASVLGYAYGTYSNNPAECLADYLTNKVYGCGLSINDEDLDLDIFYDHKQFCDDIVTHNDPDGNSVTSKRYQCNGYVNTNDTKDLSISDIVSNSQSIFSYTLGKFQMISDTTKGTNKTFDNTNIYGDVTVVNDGFNSTLNEITLKFKSKAEAYQDDQVFLNYSEKYFNEPILSKDLDLKFINTNVEAQRVGTVLLNKSRSNKIISFKTDTNAANLQVNDVIEVKDTYYSLNDIGSFYANFTNNSNDGTSLANAPGVYYLYDDDENKVRLYRDGTEAKLTVPSHIATYDELMLFFKECMNGMFEDEYSSITFEQQKQNNKFGEIINLVEVRDSFTTGGTYGGGFIFHPHQHVTNPGATYNNELRMFTETAIFGTSLSSNRQERGNLTVGTKFRVNSISEQELEGGVQGYYLTAQEYNAADYTVGTLTAKANAPAISSSRGYTNVGTVTNLVLNNTYPNASVPYVDISFDTTSVTNIEGVEVYYSSTITGDKNIVGNFNSPTGNYAASSTQQYNITGIPITSDLYIWIRAYNTFSRGDYSTGLSVGSWNPANASTNVGTDSVSQNSIQDNAVGSDQIEDNSVGSDQLANIVDLTGKTVTLPAEAVKAHTGIWDSTIKTADFTVVNQAYWLGYFIDTTSNTVTITLPTAPDDGDIIKLIDVGANAATNNIIIDGNSNNIQGSSSNYNINTNRSGTEFIFLTGKGWILTHN